MSEFEDKTPAASPDPADGGSEPSGSPVVASSNKSSRVARSVERGLRRWQARGPAEAIAAPVADPALDYLEELRNTAIGREWLEHDPFAPPARSVPPPKGPGMVAPLPRRKLLDTQPDGDASPPRSKRTTFEAGVLRTVTRFFMWSYALSLFLMKSFFDFLARRSSMERRAAHARRIMENLGPSFVKLGQQLSVRADLLPYAYCQEFAKMLDNVAPMESDQAIAAIERMTGKKVTDVFSIFDPKPVGSGSLACVYQAILQNGDRVAVKVRRPGIKNVAAADCRAISWLLGLLETMGLAAPKTREKVGEQLTSMLADELNFHLEARNTELFRAEAEKLDPPCVSAPKVYFELCGEEVIVTEFIEGVSMSELLGAVDRQDLRALEHLRNVQIDPEVVARNMIRIFHWSLMEAMLFNADPHPANMLVQPGNKIVLIDFGCCGRMSSKERRLVKQLRLYQSQADVTGMANTAVAMMGPLPPIDVDRFTKEIESVYWDQLYALRSHQSAWWEKSAAHTFMNIVAVAQKYRVPAQGESMRGIRLSIIYDTIAFRLSNDLDLTGEYLAYQREAAERSKKRVKKSLRKRRRRGLTREDYVAMEEIGQMVVQALAKAQRLLDTPTREFGYLSGKASYFMSSMLRLVSVVIGLCGVGLLATFVHEARTGVPMGVSERFAYLVNVPSLVLVLGVGFFMVRRVQRRLAQVDVKRD